VRRRVFSGGLTTDANLFEMILRLHKTWYILVQSLYFQSEFHLRSHRLSRPTRIAVQIILWPHSSDSLERIVVYRIVFHFVFTIIAFIVCYCYNNTYIDTANRLNRKDLNMLLGPLTPPIHVVIIHGFRGTTATHRLLRWCQHYTQTLGEQYYNG